ncbi:hypothetical protein Tco_1031314 [Tanacetum coccineum]|uniref:Uncharacterized protein n=1 Tax=Tanacetum coccineum TaxID=301880 RepID=A0ABQ5G8M4_9ASTR
MGYLHGINDAIKVTLFDVIKVAVERVSIPKMRRSKTVVEEVGQSEEVFDDTNYEETEDDEEEPLVRRRPTGVVIGREFHRESEKESLDHSKKLKEMEILSTVVQLKIVLKKAKRSSKDDFILQQCLRVSGEGFGVALEVPDRINQKGLNEGSDIFTDDESKGADEKEKADESRKAYAENAETDKADEEKAEEEHVEDQVEMDKLEMLKQRFIFLNPKLRSLMQQKSVPV